jgi:hypothetical protein
MGLERIGVMRGAVRRMFGAMVRVLAARRVVMRRRLDGAVLRRLAMNRRAGHADARGSRMQRQHGHQEPEQEGLESSVHSGEKYSTTDFPENRQVQAAVWTFRQWEGQAFSRIAECDSSGIIKTRTIAFPSVSKDAR